MNKSKKIIISALVTTMITSICVSCSTTLGSNSNDTKQENYEGRTFYEIFVRSFKDSDGDGIGDLKGVEESLDYLEDLGVKGIWLMPITSAASYHGYDTVDYYTIEEDYGTMEDLESLIKAAKEHDIKIIMDLVINHTSTDDPWFIDAGTDEDSEYRDYYIWSDDTSKESEMTSMGTTKWNQYKDTDELYTSVFWSGMPDLNMDNETVVNEMKSVAKFYLDKGIDGFRFDAAKWIFDDDEKNVEFWKDFSSYIKGINKDAIIVGEVWDEPYSIYTYASGLDSFFDFEVGDNIVKKLSSSSISSIVDSYNRYYDMYKEQSEDFVLAPFLSNHDTNRIMTQLNGDVDKAKMAAAIYLTLPGTPFIYYGEELGMVGAKPDEDIRLPFMWSSTDNSLNTSWITSKYDNSSVALDTEEKDEDSLYNFYKDILAVKNSTQSLRLGTAESISTEDSSVLVMKRSYEDETTYVIVNSANKDKTIKIGDDKYKVLFSNDDNIKVDDEINGDFTVQAGKVLIVK